MTYVRNFEGKANQFVIVTDDGYIFQSYDSTIAFWDFEKLTLYPMWDYSHTTIKYLHRFIDDYTELDSKHDVKVIRKMIADSTIKLSE